MVHIQASSQFFVGWIPPLRLSPLLATSFVHYKDFLFLHLPLLWLWYQDNAALTKLVWECSYLFTSSEELRITVRFCFRKTVFILFEKGGETKPNREEEQGKEGSNRKEKEGRRGERKRQGRKGKGEKRALQVMTHFLMPAIVGPDLVQSKESGTQSKSSSCVEVTRLREQTSAAIRHVY